MMAGRDRAVEQLSFRCLGCDEAVALPSQPTQPLVCSSCARAYAVDGGIVMLDDGTAQHDGSQPDDYSVLIETEPKHFWFPARNRLIRATLEETIGPLVGRSVVDIGCGTGFVLAELDRAGMATCAIDVQLDCLRCARERTRGPVLWRSAYRLPFERQFDAALLCDVIEHLDDDVGALREAAQALRPGGALLLTVPAHGWLWSTLDDVSGHKRRYERRTLRQAIVAAGLEPRIIRHFNTLLTPLQLAQRLVMRRQPIRTPAERMRVIRASMQVPPGPLNAALGLLTRFDVPLGKLGIPFGSSLVATAIKR